MIKIWYIDIKDVVEGPFSKDELRRDLRMTPEILVWREGFEGWVPAGDVIELSSLFDMDFEDESEGGEDVAEEEEDDIPVLDDELVLEYGEEPPQYKLWLILALIIIAVTITYLYSISG